MSKTKKTIGLYITAAVLVVAVLISGSICALNLFKNTAELDDDGVVYIDDFPVLKQTVNLDVFDEEDFPAQKYQITVERFLMGGILKNISFRKTIISETSDESIYKINFEKDGSYRITLKDITASRTQALTDNESSENSEGLTVIIDVIVDNSNSEAVDKADIFSETEENELISTDPEKTESEFLEANEADWDEFEKLFADLYANTDTYDSSKPDSGHVAVTALNVTFGGTYHICSQTYDLPERQVLDTMYGDPADPEKRFVNYVDSRYYKVSADTVGWIVRNIYNAEPTTETEYFSMPSFCCWYLNDGYYYAPIEVGGAGDTWTVSVKNAEKTDDGKYIVTVHIEMEDYGTKEDVGDCQVKAKLCEVDSKRVWSFEKWGKSVVTDKTEEPTSAAVTQPTEQDKTQTPTQSQTQPTGVEQMYKNYVSANPNKFFKYEGHSTSAEPQYDLIDLDQDGTKEAVVTSKFYDTEAYMSDFAIVHILGVKDGNVKCVFSSELVSTPRMTEKIRIFKDTDGKIYIHRYWRDGRNSQIETVYTYNRGNLIVEYGLLGNFNTTPKSFEKGIGKDSFNSSSESFVSITEDEFLEIRDNLENRGTTYYFTEDLFDGVALKR